LRSLCDDIGIYPKLFFAFYFHLSDLSSTVVDDMTLNIY